MRTDHDVNRLFIRQMFTWSIMADNIIAFIEKKKVLIQNYNKIINAQAGERQRKKHSSKLKWNSFIYFLSNSSMPTFD